MSVGAVRPRLRAAISSACIPPNPRLPRPPALPRDRLSQLPLRFQSCFLILPTKGSCVAEARGASPDVAPESIVQRRNPQPPNAWLIGWGRCRTAEPPRTSPQGQAPRLRLVQVPVHARRPTIHVPEGGLTVLRETGCRRRVGRAFCALDDPFALCSEPARGDAPAIASEREAGNGAARGRGPRRGVSAPEQLAGTSWRGSIRGAKFSPSSRGQFAQQFLSRGPFLP
jgi:hypothetical protein